jgi:hypothetical protein
MGRPPGAGSRPPGSTVTAGTSGERIGSGPLLERRSGLRRGGQMTSTMPYELPGACEEVDVRLLRFIAVLLLAAAAFAFVARLLKPRAVLRDIEGDLGYVPPTAAEGPGVTVPDAIPLDVPGPRSPSDQASPVG